VPCPSRRFYRFRATGIRPVPSRIVKRSQQDDDGSKRQEVSAQQVRVVAALSGCSVLHPAPTRSQICSCTSPNTQVPLCLSSSRAGGQAVRVVAIREAHAATKTGRVLGKVGHAYVDDGRKCAVRRCGEAGSVGRRRVNSVQSRSGWWRTPWCWLG
jgi:hypothetical protein